MSKIIINEAMYVCRTGRLQQFYTLYIERSVINGGFCLNSYRFVQNLSKEEGAAWDKAKKMFDDRKEVLTSSWGKGKYYLDIDMIDSPKREYCDLKAFGFEWKKTEKGFTTEPDRDFWTIWRKHKTSLKEAGFSVFKDYKGFFVLFFRNTTDEKMVEAFDLLESKVQNQVVTGKYMGEIKERLRDIPAYVERVFTKDSFYGTTQVATFVYGAHTFTTFYSGKTEIKEGSNVMLTGTVKDHKEYDGKKVTILNRIIVDTISE